MSSPKIYPVIHYLDRETSFAEVGTAVLCGADGVFLISHHGNDQELLDVGAAIRKKHPGFPIGINLLSTNARDAKANAVSLGFPMLWGDDVGVDSTGLTEVGSHMAAPCPGLMVFASVAFKYRPYEPDAAKAARCALEAGFIPTTSGPGTGSAPDIEKIVAMSMATGGMLAIASGMTPWNVAEYAPFLSHILVATGIAIDEHRMDADKLGLLIANARAGTHCAAEDGVLAETNRTTSGAIGQP